MRRFGTRRMIAAWLAAAGSVALGATSVSAATGDLVGGTMSTCFWYYGAVGGAADAYNVAYPDAGAFYWAAYYRVPAGSSLKLHGTFPHARYTSLIAYDGLGQPVDGLADYQYEPDAGSTNPFRPGADRTAAHRSYTIDVLHQKNLNPATGQPLFPTAPAKYGQAPRNYLFATPNTPNVETVGGQTHSLEVLILRTYVPDVGADYNGDVPLPEPELTLADGTLLTGQALCDATDSESKDRLANGLPVRLPSPTSLLMDTRTYQALRHPETLTQACNVLAPNCPTTFTVPPALVQVPRSILDPLTFPATNPVSWRADYNRRWLLQLYTGDDAPGASLTPTRAGSGFFPNIHAIGYTRAALNRNFGKVAVVRGKLPSSPRTWDGDATFPTDVFQSRYTSLCMNESVRTTKVMDCVFDEEIPTDSEGFYNVVVSRAEDKPSNADQACGRAWIEWKASGDGETAPGAPVDADFGWLWIRNMLVDPTFAEATQNTAHPGDEEAVMGDYLPEVTYLDPADVELSGCSFSGVLPPIRSDGSSIFKLGSTVPVKFRLADIDGNPIDGAVATLEVAKVSNQIEGTYVEAVSTCAATTGNQFRSVGRGKYVFNLATKGLSVGTWRLRIELQDGSQHLAQISLR